MVDTKSQKISVKIPLQDYGWLMRYAAGHDTTVSQLVRKAIRMYIVAVENRKGNNNETNKE